MADMTTVKKDFQDVVAKIRAQLGGGPYPKAMMTSQQMMNRTATINCFTYIGKAKTVLLHPLFKHFLERYNATAHLEEKDEGYGFPIQHIRINF